MPPRYVGRMLLCRSSPGLASRAAWILGVRARVPVRQHPRSCTPGEDARKRFLAYAEHRGSSGAAQRRSAMVTPDSADAAAARAPDRPAKIARIRELLDAHGA